MKKYIITLAVVALAIGGSINFAGCSGGPAEDPNATGETTNAPPAGMSEEQKKMAKRRKSSKYGMGGADAAAKAKPPIAGAKCVEKASNARPLLVLLRCVISA